MDQELEQARIKHLAFKSKVRALLYGADVADDTVLLETHCALGKWICETGRQLYAQFPEMAELEKTHTHIHRIVQKLVDLCHKNQHEEARLGMAEIEELSDLMTQILENMDKRIQAQT